MLYGITEYVVPTYYSKSIQNYDESNIIKRSTLCYTVLEKICQINSFKYINSWK